MTTPTPTAPATVTVPKRPRCSAKVRRAAARALDAAGEDSPIAVTVPDLQTPRTMREYAALCRFLHAWIVRAAAQAGEIEQPAQDTPLFDALADASANTTPTPQQEP